MNRLLAWPTMTVLIGVLACATAATEAPTAPTQTPLSTAAPTSTIELETPATLPPSPISDSKPLSTDMPARVAIIVDQPEVGTNVGDTVPHFEFTLADGTKKSTAQFSTEGQPVFLFFFATW